MLPLVELLLIVRLPVSDPLAVPKTAQLMRERGIADEHIRRVTYDNALTAFAAGGQMAEGDWLSPPAIDQRTLFEGVPQPCEVGRYHSLIAAPATMPWNPCGNAGW